MSARKKRKILSAVAIGVTVLMAAAFLIAPDRGLVGVYFIGITNALNHERLAVFQVTNVHNRSIQYRWAIESKTNSYWPIEKIGNGGTVPFTGESHNLGGRESTLVTILPPATGTWRLLIGYEKSTNRYDERAFRVRRRLIAWHLGFVAERIPCEKNKFWMISSREMVE